MWRSHSLEADYSAPVIDTLRKSGFELDDCIVIGGAVLALNDIRPAGDLDIILNPFVFRETAIAGQTPGGVILRATNDGLLGTRLKSDVKDPPDDILALDLNTFNGKRAIFEFQDLKTRTVKIDSDLGDISAVSLADVLSIKARAWRYKDRRDARKIRNSLSFG